MADCSRQMEQPHWMNDRLWQSWIWAHAMIMNQTIWDYGLERKIKSGRINIPEQKDFDTWTSEDQFCRWFVFFIASGMLQVCCIHAELLLFPLLKPPSWISDFRLHQTVWIIVFLNLSTLKTWELFLEFCSYVVYRLKYKYFLFWAAILDFWLSLASHSMENIFIGFLNLENMSAVVGILQLCCIHAEILVFPLREPPSWISDFRLHHTIQYIAFLNSWTKKIWVEPLELCSYLAYELSYWFFQVFQKNNHHLQPPSWISEWQYRCNNCATL